MMSSANASNERMELEWEVGPANGPEARPDRLVTASVPGAVQLDWARANGWPSYTRGLEAERYRGLEDFRWIYRAALPDAEPADSRERWLVIEDVDHHGRVYLNGTLLGEGGGIGRRLEFKLPEAPAGSRIEIALDPAPKIPGAAGRERARMTTKAAVSYGWDFHPDLIPLGIAGGAWIERRHPSHIAAVTLRPRVPPSLDRAELHATISVRGGGRLTARLLDPDGTCAWEESRETDAGEVRFEAVLEKPRLWWPHGQGDQPLYTFHAELCRADGTALSECSRRCGFRRMRLVMAPGQWEEPATAPLSRNRPPVTVEVNGRRIFAMGANVTPPDIFRGSVEVDRWRGIVHRAADAGMNMLRLWGGAPAPHDAFYDACDERGVMLIQEFPLACNNYPDDPAYLAELEALARDMIERLAFRPCLAIWSGGNELFNAWSRMTDQSHALRLLGSLCWQLDPQTPFLPTLPVEGLGHGSYTFRLGREKECFAAFQDASRTGYTEFGVSSPAPLATFREVLEDRPSWPPEAGGVWALHHACGAWDVDPASWLYLGAVEHYWGGQPGLEACLGKAHWLAAEGLRGMIEEARRQKPRCGWALVWCLNEPWTALANCSIIAWPDTPKPAYAAVASAMRPTLASARIHKFQWAGGEEFTAELAVLHDGPGPRPALRIEVTLASGDWRKTIHTWHAPTGEPAENLAGPTVRTTLPDRLDDDLVIELACSVPDYSTRYRLATHPPPGRNQ